MQRDVRVSCGMWRTAPCQSWTPNCTLDDTIVGRQYIARFAGGVEMSPKWSFAMGVKKGTTSGVWTLLYSQCQLEHGPARNIKVHYPFSYREWGYSHT